MATAAPIKNPVPVGQLLRRRLRELNRTPRELAAAVKVSEGFIADLVAGRRRAPAPSRSDLYTPMAKFLRLHRNDLPTCARAEHAIAPAARRPSPEVRRLTFELCHQDTVRALTRRVTRRDGAELECLIVQRLLGVAQGFVIRQLEDEAGLSVAAAREGRSYLELRMRLLDFLDATPDSVTARDYEDFVRPRIASWELDLETRAMRIVLRSREVAPRRRRAFGL